MRPGLFPSQQRAIQKAFRKADAFDHFRQRTRRGFIGAIFGGIAASAGTFFAGLQIAAAAPASRPPMPAPPFDAVALGPIERLEARALEVLAEIEMGRASTALWVGVERLALRSLVEPHRDALRARLLATRAAVAVPPALQSTFARLEAMTKGR